MAFITINTRPLSSYAATSFCFLPENFLSNLPLFRRFRLSINFLFNVTNAIHQKIYKKCRYRFSAQKDLYHSKSCVHCPIHYFLYRATRHGRGVGEWGESPLLVSKNISPPLEPKIRYLRKISGQERQIIAIFNNLLSFFLFFVVL